MKKKIRKTIPENIGRRWIRVLDPIFHQRIHVLLNHTDEDYRKWLKRIKAKDKEPVSYTDFAGFSSDVSNKDGKTEWIICVHHFNWAIKCQGTLIHEIVHTVIKLFKSNNIPFNDDTQEFIAHQIGNIYEEVATKLLVPIRQKKPRSK